jgi:hypothetical protein
VSGRRVLLFALALTAQAVASYLTLYQLGAIAHPWDPFFDPEPVLDLTEPVPDAAAGALAYATELVLLVPGGRDRERTHPWTCLALGAVLCGGAAVSVALVVIQPAVVGSWCTLCLVSAALSFLLFGLGIGEARSAWRHLQRRPEAALR